MSDSQSHLLRVAAARADFLDSGSAGAAGVDATIAASWARCHQGGVDHDHPVPEFTEVDSGSRLVRCARPVLRQLGQDTSGMSLVVALTDRRARLIKRVDSSSAVARLLDRVNFVPGFDYAESRMGTNGVGTVIESGKAVSIVGPEHYSESLQPFACTGAPVIDPLSGRIEGILDISTLASSWSPLMHTLVKAAAKDIGRNLLLDRSQAQQALFDTYLKTESRNSHSGIFAFADSVFMANALAQKDFDASEQLSIREHATFLMLRRDRATDTLKLPSGRLVHVRGTRIISGHDTAGMVVITDIITAPNTTPITAALTDTGNIADEVLPEVSVASAHTRQLIGGLSRQHAPIAEGNSPTWIRACEELRTALLHKASTIVMGETGSGKFTLVTELHHVDHPGARSVSVDAAQLSTTEIGDMHGLVNGAKKPTLCIIRNLDQATTDGVEWLEEFFASDKAEAELTVVGTLSDSNLDSDLPFHPLLRHFEVAVTVPPLRCRTEDLSLILSRLLREIAPRRRVRLSPGAERTIRRYSWPRNVAQLREALEHALRIRPVGEVQESDLPSYCHTTSRRILTPLERAERDAIVAALQECDGVRQTAAQQLGMARSSLYRKLKAYGITA